MITMSEEEVKVLKEMTIKGMESFTKIINYLGEELPSDDNIVENTNEHIEK